MKSAETNVETSTETKVAATSVEMKGVEKVEAMKAEEAKDATESVNLSANAIMLA
jgi:hypothetical protein